MTRDRRWFVWGALLLAACIVGCKSPTPATQPQPTVAVSEFNDLLSRQGRVIFLSWNGKWIGMDGDADVTFLPGGAVEMTRYSVGVQRFQGTYQLEPAGVVTVQLHAYNGVWPSMVLEKDKTSLILRPKDSKRQGEDGAYWPFRQVERKPFEDSATQPSK